MYVGPNRTHARTIVLSVRTVGRKRARCGAGHPPADSSAGRGGRAARTLLACVFLVVLVRVLVLVKRTARGSGRGEKEDARGGGRLANVPVCPA
jgi:hypothetical protein